MTRRASQTLFAGLTSVALFSGSAAAQSRAYTLLLFDQLEYRSQGSGSAFRWDVQNWIGGDYNRLWIKTEGLVHTARSQGEAEAQVLYSRLIAPFWDLQAGLFYERRYRPGPDRSRVLGVIGLQGLAPYWFDVESALFVSDNADLSARLTATTDLLFTQRLIAQPRFELNGAAQKAEEFGVGAGLNSVELGLRLRYELRREFAPYVGISWVRRLGETAALARRQGDQTGDFAVLAAVRLWY